MQTAMTIDDALSLLAQAKSQLGGDACLILSLTASELEDVNVSGMSIIAEDESRYVQVEATHPALTRRRSG